MTLASPAKRLSAVPSTARLIPTFVQSRATATRPDAMASVSTRLSVSIMSLLSRSDFDFFSPISGFLVLFALSMFPAFVLDRLRILTTHIELSRCRIADRNHGRRGTHSILRRTAPYAMGPLSVLSVLSVTLVYCGQTVGWIKMPLGTEVGLGPGHIVLHWDQLTPTKRGTAPPPTFRPTLLWQGRPSQQLLSCCFIIT